MFDRYRYDLLLLAWRRARLLRFELRKTEGRMSRCVHFHLNREKGLLLYFVSTCLAAFQIPTKRGDMIFTNRWMVALIAGLLPWTAGAQTAPATADAAKPAAVAPDAYPARPQKMPMTSQWTSTFYGFIEFDMEHDSNQLTAEGIGANPTVPRPSTVTGSNGRTSFTGRNSRFGYKIGAPEYDSMKASAVIEADFEALL